MNETAGAQAEHMAAELAASCARMAAAASSGDIDDALAELSVQAGLQQALEPLLADATGVSPDATAGSTGPEHRRRPFRGPAADTRERIARLLRQAHASSGTAEAFLHQAREAFRTRLAATRSSAPAAAAYGAMDLPLSSGFRSRS